MSINFVASMDFHSSAPEAETFALSNEDQTAFARLFPFSLSAFKTGLAENLPGFSLADPEIKCAARAIIQSGLVGGGASVSAAAARSQVIIRQSCALRLTLEILSGAGA
jgi:hypothetical protein